MVATDLEIKDFDPQTAGEADFALLNAFDNRLGAEAWPEDPPSTLEETIRNRRSTPPFFINREWVVCRADGSEVVAHGSAGYPETPENRHLAQFWIGVLPEMRRKGIAKALLRRVADLARTAERRLLMTRTSSSVPAGEAFMDRLGARMGLATYTNQLLIADLNRDLVREWQERAAALKGEFELGLWTGPYPEADIEAITRLETVMNTAPRDDLEMEDSSPSVERLRQWETSLLQRKVERWTIYARGLRSGELAGYTEVFWNPDQPQILAQGDTGVFPAYRNRGLGRWLKAAMLEKVLRERPEVTTVRTGNALSNAPMLRINEELGFRPRQSNFMWQVGLDRVFDYLGQ